MGLTWPRLSTKTPAPGVTKFTGKLDPSWSSLLYIHEYRGWSLKKPLHFHYITIHVCHALAQEPLPRGHKLYSFSISFMVIITKFQFLWSMPGSREDFKRKKCIFIIWLIWQCSSTAKPSQGVMEFTVLV